jgi:ribosome-associated protein
MASAETRKMVLAATAAGAEKKAEDTRILELDKSESGFTDFFLIMSGTNTRQVVAISDEIELRLKREFGSYPNAVEGRRLGEWVLMDYVDFVVHIFVAEKRAYYDIERLRKSATSLDIDQLKAALTEKVKAARKKLAVEKTVADKKTRREKTTVAAKSAVTKKKSSVRKVSTARKAAKKTTK